jgi:hypothetical protein
MLARHPGLPYVPQWSARGIRWYWAGVVAWNVGFALLLAVGVFPVAASPGRPRMVPSWTPVVIPVLFVAMWIGVSYLLAGIAGWHTLARHYAAADAMDGTRFRFRSAKVGSVNYGGCVNFVTSLRGLAISTMPLFRAGHPPLFVPWADVSARRVPQWFASAVELEFVRAPGVSLRVSPHLGEALIRQSGGRVPMPPVR